MEFTAEQIEQLKLSDDQVSNLSSIFDDNVAIEKKAWDGKANTDAQAILDDVATGIETMTGIKREKGQKHKDYLTIASEGYLKGQKADLERRLKEDGDELSKKEILRLKGEIEGINGQINGFKEKAAKYDEWEAENYKEKYENAAQELTGIKLMTAFNQVRPSFPDSVNKYEAKAKWDEFIAGIKSKNNIELDNDGIAWAVDKDNEHKRVKLESLVEKDKAIQEIVKGRSVTGFGNKEKGEDISIDGLPFKVDLMEKPSEIQKKIREYISTELKLSVTSSEYSKKFSEYYSLIKKSQQNA